MNNEQSSRSTRRLILFCSIVVAAILGAFASRLAFPLRQPTSQRPGRPIVQLVRVEPGFPNLADMIDGACPSVALIQHRGVEAATTTASKTNFASAFAISADGWLLTTTSQLPPGPLEVVFGDGKRVALGEVRADAVSGLAIVKASGAMRESNLSGP